jgi:hypothetical protein
MVGVTGQSEDHDVTNFGAGHLVTPDPERDPLLVGDIHGEVTPVQRVSTRWGPKVLSDHQPFLSLWHVSSFAEHPNSPLRRSFYFG